jgi:hypothetical protein
MRIPPSPAPAPLRRWFAPLLAVVILLIAALFGTRADAQTATHKPTSTRTMTHVAKGSFNVQIQPQGEPSAADGVSLGRMSLDKTFEGDFTGTGRGEMLSAMTAVKGSAGYVAIERVSGSLNGRRGSFVMQHTGTMTRGAPQLAITIVPDSGTGELTGIAGVFKLRQAEGKHFYEIDYTLPATSAP